MSIIDPDVVEDHERFRSELASLYPDGRRRWIFARKPSGRYYDWRKRTSIVLLAFLFSAPFVTIGGHQFLLFNIIDRKFVFFGWPLWPSDFYLVVLLFLIGLLSVVVFTATLGRLWCGWLCPQTVFMEIVFRRIEWFIDGGPTEQARRRTGPWNVDRVLRTALKVSVFFAVSFAIANTFLAYVIGSDTLLLYIQDGPFEHVSLFASLLVFTTVFFLVFYRFREQACVIVCPYGRYMSSLVDENTIAVTYDYVRGESRAKWTRADTVARSATTPEKPTEWSRPTQHGDCVDCHQCVTVCPTGIDIRDGIQLECVNCTACIDACDDVMDKVQLPRGLIRNTSASAVLKGHTTWLTPRIKAYAAVWLVLVGVVVTLFVMRSDVDVQIVRQSGSLWQSTSDGTANFYQVQIINKSTSERSIQMRVVEPHGAIVKVLGKMSILPSNEIVRARLMIIIPDSLRTSENMHVTLDVETNGLARARHVLSFVSPPR